MKSQSIRFSRVTRIILLPLLLLLFIVFQAYGATPGKRLWVRRYNGPGNSDDYALDIAVDPSGNVYVTGFGTGSGTYEDFATIKYNSAGNKKWVRRYNGPGNSDDKAGAIAVDKNGNVYVTGSSGGSTTRQDYATIKYDSAGTKKWVRRYNGPGNGDDWTMAIAVDSSGNVYVTGSSTGSGTGYDYATIKYDSAGTKKWVRRYNGPGNGQDWANAIAIDTSGNVYVTGTSTGSSTGNDFATIKYDSAGNKMWERRHNGPKTDVANAIAVDPSGNVYVTGYDTGPGGCNYVTFKYDSAGTLAWQRGYYGTTLGYDSARAIALDTSSNIYVTGYSEGSGTGFDYATIKYNSAGNRLWVRRYNGPAYGGDGATAIAVDSSGNVYVTGHRTSCGTGVDYATIKYGPGGIKKWVRRYNGPGNGQDWANAITIDPSGNIYVTGQSTGSGTGYDYATIKYAP